MRLSRVYLAISMSIIALVLQAGSARAMQLGSTGSGSSKVYGAKAMIHQPSEFTNGTYSRAYWLGVTFPNGTFFQAGYLDASNQYSDLCQTGFSRFVTALNSNGNSVFPSLYNNGNCNLTGAHTFKLVASSRGESATTWQWYLSGNAIGPALTLPSSQSQFQRLNAGSITEIVEPGNIVGSPPLATVRYSPAIQVEPTLADSWDDVTTGLFTSTSDRTCKYALAVDADNDFRTGAQVTVDAAHCHSNGDELW